MRLRLWRRAFLLSSTALLLGRCDVPEQGLPVGTDQARQGVPDFLEVAQETGLGFRHFTGSTGEYFMPEIMGPGVGLLDYDTDGDLDVYLLQGSLLDPGNGMDGVRFPPPVEHWPGSRLFRNELIQEGALRFTDVTEQSGAGYEGYGMGIAVGDIDNDGHPDMFVTGFGPNRLYRNRGDGTFASIPLPGLDGSRWSASAAFCDYDGDGLLDIYVANYIDFTVRNNKTCYDPTGARDYCSPNLFNPVPDRLLRNLGRGQFRDVSSEVGIGAAFGSGLGVACADWDGDGLTDFYVANDGVPNQLWRNRGDGTFEDVAYLSGAAVNGDGLAEAGMGVVSGDFDSDGDEDLLVTHLAGETNTLYSNGGNGDFRDVTERFRLGSGSFPSTGFGASWLDYDNDGWLDLFLANGAVTIVESLRSDPYPFHQENRLLRNLAGSRFADVSYSAGLALGLSEVSRGAALGDIDNDGDSDIVVANNNGPVRLLLNQVGNRHNWLQVRLEGVMNNRDGYGARVAVLQDSSRLPWRRSHSDGSYLSASDPRVHFGLGESQTVQAVGVVWPNGRQEIWRGIEVNAAHSLREGTGEPWARKD